MATRVEAMSETDPRIFTARHQRAAAGLPSPEHSKIKLDPRVAAFLTGATLAALGIISLAIDSAASVDVSTHPPYSPAPTEQVKPAAIQTVETTRTKTEPTKLAATPTEIVVPEPSPSPNKNILKEQTLSPLSEIPMADNDKLFIKKWAVVCSVHPVQEGDTLTAVAAKNHTTVADIVEANKTISDPDNIDVGWNLAIPCKPESPEYQEKLEANKGILIFTQEDTREVISTPVGEEVPLTIYVEKWGAPLKAVTVTLKVNEDGEIREYDFRTKENGRLSIKFRPAHSGYFMILPSVEGIDADRAIIVAGR